MAAVLAGCESRSMRAEIAGTGPRPSLPEPNPSLIPTVNIAPAKGWPADGAPTGAAGLRVTALARDLAHPRWLHVLPNGDVLVAETAAPERPEEGKGLRGKVMMMAMKKAGSVVPSANRVTLLRDADGDGVAEVRAALVEGLNSPFGMAVVGDTLYVANTDSVVKLPYREGATRIDAAPEKIADLPAGPRNRHWTKGLLASPDGRRLYVAVGSNSDHAENGLDQERDRAAIHEIDLSTGEKRVFATGLRNPVGMDWEPRTGALWAAVNERDELGNDLVPDYITSVRDGGFYGWPWSYFGQHVDERVKPPRPDRVAEARVPDYALGAHTASLGLAFVPAAGSGERAARGEAGQAAAAGGIAARFGEGAFVGQHGSWNRRPHSGYKVVFVPFRDGRPAGEPQDVLTGFLNAEGEALGRPVGVAIDRQGALLVADDVGNVVWRVTADGGGGAGGKIVDGQR